VYSHLTVSCVDAGTVFQGEETTREVTTRHRMGIHMTIRKGRRDVIRIGRRDDVT